MAENLRKCPLCQGEGKLPAATIREWLANEDVRREVESCLAEASRPVPAGAAIAKGPADRDFNKEVHHWNPQLPIWRRSPKE